MLLLRAADGDNGCEVDDVDVGLKQNLVSAVGLAQTYGGRVDWGRGRAGG